MAKTESENDAVKSRSTAALFSTAEAIDPNALPPIDRRTDGLASDSKATPFSAFLWAVVSGDIASAEAQLTDDVEWGLMPYNKVLKGKDRVIPWLRAAAADQKKPVVISNAVADNWGVFEYWNIGIVSDAVINLGNKQGWPWPDDPEKFKGKEYRIAQCFTYHFNADGKIDFMRQYLDTGSVFAQFE
jgi:ketosteroid isomerase-like protein